MNSHIAGERALGAGGAVRGGGGAWCVRAHAREAWAMPSTPSSMARRCGRGGDRRLEGGSGGSGEGLWAGDRPAGLARIGAGGVG